MLAGRSPRRAPPLSWWHATAPPPGPPPPLERTEVAAARVGALHLRGRRLRAANRHLAAVERYDIRRRPLEARARTCRSRVNHPTAVAYRGDLYVHGGYAAGRALTQPTGALLRYDPERNRWRRLRASPTPRAAHAVAVIGHRLYAAGGANDSGSLRSLEVYDFEPRRWSRGPSFPGPARNHTTGVASGGRFYVLAGRDSGNFTRPSATTRAGAAGSGCRRCARRAAGSPRRA